MFLKAQKLGDTRGLSVPWHYLRRQIAAAWFCSPKAFDQIIEEDPEELRIELAIRRIEAEVERR